MHRFARIPTILLTLTAPLACGDAGSAATDTDAGIPLTLVHHRG